MRDNYPRTYHIPLFDTITGLAIAVFVVSSSCVRLPIHNIELVLSEAEDCFIVRWRELLFDQSTPYRRESPIFEVLPFCRSPRRRVPFESKYFICSSAYWFLQSALKFLQYIHLPIPVEKIAGRLEVVVSDKLFSLRKFFCPVMQVTCTIVFEITLSFSFLSRCFKTTAVFYFELIFYLCMR